jgi:2-(1,2-epoxy-1,2-dihydrophenyl)acetyl-CoA isomerase
MSSDALGVDDEGPVRVFTFMRPRKLNALSIELALELTDELRRAQHEAAGPRAVVLCGVGEHFSAGGDARSIVEAIEGPEGSVAELMATFHALIKTIWSSPLPIVAAVSGVVYGGGFNLALACDLVVSAADARFCQVFVDRGLVPDLGGAFFLPRLAGLQKAKEFMLFRPELSAAQAEELGFVNQVVQDTGQLREQATGLGQRLAALPPTAVSLTKRLVNSAAGDLSASLELEAMAQTIALMTPRAREGFQRFLT